MGLQTSPLGCFGIDLVLPQKISAKHSLYLWAVSSSLTAILAAIVIVLVWPFGATFEALPFLLTGTELIGLIACGFVGAVANLGFEL